eukprot:gene7706-11835_t
MTDGSENELATVQRAEAEEREQIALQKDKNLANLRLEDVENRSKLLAETDCDWGCHGPKLSALSCNPATGVTPLRKQDSVLSKAVKRAEKLQSEESTARGRLITQCDKAFAVLRYDWIESAARLCKASTRNLSSASTDDSPSSPTFSSLASQKNKKQDETEGTRTHKVPQANVLTDNLYQVEKYDEAHSVEVDFETMATPDKRALGTLAVHVWLPTRPLFPALLLHVLETLRLSDEDVAELLGLCPQGRKAAELPFETVQTAARAFPADKRLAAIAAIAATGLKSGVYDARLRWGLHRLSTILSVPWEHVAVAETILAATLLDRIDGDHSAQGKGSSYRWLKIGAGVTLGAGALLITAVAAAIGTTAASLGAVMTVPVITALFGAAGAGVTGMKVYRRTAGVNEFVCNSIRDVELPAWVISDPCTVLETDRGQGPAVPMAVRETTSKNVAARVDTDRKVVLSLLNNVEELGELYLSGTYLEIGDWMYKPPKAVKVGQAAIAAASKTRFGLRVSGCVVYANKESNIEFLCAFDCPVVGNFKHRIVHGPIGTFQELHEWKDRALGQSEDSKVVTLLPSKTRVTIAASGVCEAFFDIRPFGILKTPVETGIADIDEVTEILPKCDALMEAHRSKVAVTIRNLLTDDLMLAKVFMDYGQLAKMPAVAHRLPTGKAAVFIGHNRHLRYTGVAGVFVYTFEDFVVCLAVNYPASGKNMRAFAAFYPCGLKEALHDGSLSKLLAEKKPEDAATGVAIGTSRQRVLWEHPVTKKAYAVSWRITAVVLDGQGVKNDKKTQPTTPEFRFSIQEVTGPLNKAGDEVCGLHVAIGVSGILVDDDPRLKLSQLAESLWLPVLSGDLRTLHLDGADPYYIAWETELQRKLGKFMTVPADFGSVMRSAANSGATEALKNPVVAGAAGATGAAYVAMSGLMASVAFPYYLIQAADIIDSTYLILNNKAKEAGGLLAQMLLEKAQGERPVTLIGVSLGANVVYHALQALAKEPDFKGYGLVEVAILMGSTVSCDSSGWARCRSVVAGRVINVYSGCDWLLAFLHRGLTASFRKVAGLSKVLTPGVENVCVNHLVKCSADYPRKLKPILSCVPAWPTAQTFCNSDALPGIALPIADAEVELDVINDSCMSGLFLAICLRNKAEVALVFDSAEFDGGEWEVTPPEDPIVPGYAAPMLASCMGRTPSAVQCLMFFKSEEFSLVICFRLKVLSESDVTAELLPPGAERPKLAQYIADGKLGVSGGKAFLDDHVVRYERVGSKMSVTVRASEGEEPNNEELLAAFNTSVDAGICVDIPNTSTSLTALLEASREVGVAFRNKTALETVYCWTFMKYGAWRLTPPPEVPSNQAALCVAKSTYRKGVKGVVCFAVED